jgi:hypothetical protein
LLPCLIKATAKPLILPSCIGILVIDKNLIKLYYTLIVKNCNLTTKNISIMKKTRTKKMRNRELISAIKFIRQREAKYIFHRCILLLIYLNLPHTISGTLTDAKALILICFNLSVIIIGLIIVYLYPLIISRRRYLELALPYVYDDFHTLIRNAHLCCQKATYYRTRSLPSGFWGVMAKMELDQKIEEAFFMARQNEEAAKVALEHVRLLERTLDRQR